MAAAGFFLLEANWITGLGLGNWVWICLIGPGIVLFFGSMITKPGAWQYFVGLVPTVIMTLLSILKVIDSALAPLIHGSILAFVIVFAVIVMLGHSSSGHTKAAHG